MDAEEKLLSRFPKQRPELPSAYRAIYVEHYRQNREGGSPASSLARRMEAWMHKKVAQDVARMRRGYSTLEIGSGNLNHLEYEPSSNRYDIVEPFVELYENSPNRSRVQNFYRDLNEIRGLEFDRIISIAAFEHLCDLPSVVAKSALLLAPGGELRVAVPSEGTVLWKLGWTFTTGIEFRLRHGLDYGVLMRHEHVNTADEIAGILKIFFRKTRRSVLGICAPLSFYQFFQCADPDTGRCGRYLLMR